MGNTLLIRVSRAVDAPLLDFSPSELKPDRKHIYAEIRGALDSAFPGQDWCPLPESGPWMMGPRTQRGANPELDCFYPCCLASH